MYTAECLMEFHERTHQSLTKLIDHCSLFSDDELSKEIDGFGYPSLRLQLHHAIGAEKYWIGVLKGRIDVEENESDYSSIENLKRFHEEVYSATQKYLSTASADELNNARPMITWGNKEKTLIPARVITRLLAHIYQHQGQVAAICRILGKPIPPGLDYPIE